MPSGDHIARVAVRLLGTVAELRKRLGDTVRAGEVVAVIESREVADAKSEYLAARLVFDLQQTLFNRSVATSYLMSSMRAAPLPHSHVCASGWYRAPRASS